MSGRWRAWRRLLPAWLPAVLLLLGSVGYLVWLTSDSLGQAAKLRRDIEEYEAEIVRLERVLEQAAADRAEARQVQQDLAHLFNEVFSSLDVRLTRILRAVGSATREAGLLPGRFSYSAEKNRDLDAIRFGIQFAVSGQYAQVRTLLAELQASPEFLIVDRISFAGEEESPAQDLGIAIGVSTYLAEADAAQLRRLMGDSGDVEERGDVVGTD